MDIQDYIISPKQVLGRVSTMIGTTGGGKTTIVRHFLHAIRAHVEQAFIISKTALETHDFEGLVPDACIHRELSIDFIQLVFDRQTALRAAYDRINQEHIIESLYNKCQRRPDKHIAKIVGCLENNIAGLQHNDSNREEIDKIREACAELVVGMKKKTISAHKSLLSAMQLTEDERFSLEYINLNPNIVLIFDDCTTEIDRMKNHKLFKDLFFLGRHKLITTLMILHTDKAISAELKKSTAFTVFVDRPSAIAFLERASTNLSKDVRKKLIRDAERIIGTREDPEPFRWQRAVFANNRLYKFTAQIYDREPFFNRYLLGFIDMVTERSKIKLSARNKFAKMYDSR